MEYRIVRNRGVAPFQQIAEQTRQALRLGALQPGDRLPTAREVSQACTVNPNTIFKAYRELEREGLVESRPGKGTFVTASLSRPQAGADSPLAAALGSWLVQARQAGLEREDVAALVTNQLERHFPRTRERAAARPTDDEATDAHGENETRTTW